jgi:hypothetical protein
MGAAESRRADEEVVVAFPSSRERMHFPRNIRSTLIASSLRSIRERGRFDEYMSLLEASWRDVPTRAIAGVWLPFEAGVAHYRACDRLGYTLGEQLAVGREVGRRVQGTFLGTMIRGAKNAGLTPWVGLANTRRIYERLFDGGGCCVTRVGPKDARMELACNPIVSIAYFRNAMRGLWQVAFEFFCSRAYVTEIDRTEASYKVRVAWA